MSSEKGEITMTEFKAQVVINRPMEEIFAAIADMNKMDTWQTNVLESRMTSSEPIAQGSTYVYTMQLFGRRVETSGEIIHYEPPTKWGYKATSGPFPMSGYIMLETAPGGTRATWIVDAEPGGFFALARPLLKRMSERQLEGNLKNLKDMLEQPAE